jgi:hypothetical protein
LRPRLGLAGSQNGKGGRGLKFWKKDS